MQVCVCVCVGNPNYNGSVRLQYTAGGAGDTDESGTNKDAHQLSVIWQKDASGTYLLRTCDAIVVQAVYAGHHVISSLCKSRSLASFLVNQQQGNPSLLRTSHNIFFFDVSSESLLDSDWS